MDIAKSMMLGGKIVYPDECDYSSYKELLLCCPFCGQEVFLKAGACRKSHFAHFAGTDPNQVEQCELRASSYSKSSGINNFFQDRRQRLKIFQDRFLSLISLENDTPITNLEFNNWVNSIKRDRDQSIDNIITDCIHYFLKHCHKIADKYINTTVNINIQREIALEAIDYLCVKSSFNLLEYLIYFSIYKLLKNEQHKLFQQHIAGKDVASICHFVIKIIIFNNWIEVFKIEDDQLKKKSKDGKLTITPNLDDQFQNVGYLCLNDNVLHFGKDSSTILWQIWHSFPVLQEYIEQYTTDTMISIEFGLLKKQSSNVLNDIHIINNKNINSPAKMRLIDRKKIVKILVGKTQIYPMTSGTVAVLKNQMYQVELISSVLTWIDHRLLSDIFNLDGFKYPVQLRVTELGSILIQEYTLTGLKTVGLIGSITGYHEQFSGGRTIKIFDWNYSQSWKHHSTKLENHVRKHLAKCNKMKQIKRNHRDHSDYAHSRHSK